MSRNGQWTSGRGGGGMLSSERQNRSTTRTVKKCEAMEQNMWPLRDNRFDGSYPLGPLIHRQRLLTATAKPSCAALRCMGVGDETASRHVLHTNKICATRHRLDRKCVVAGRSCTYGHQDLTPANSLVGPARRSGIFSLLRPRGAWELTSLSRGVKVNLKARATRVWSMDFLGQTSFTMCSIRSGDEGFLAVTCENWMIRIKWWLLLCLQKTVSSIYSKFLRPAPRTHYR